MPGGSGGSAGSWPDLIRKGLRCGAARNSGWSQLLMAANTPMLLRAAMVDERLTWLVSPGR